MNEFEIQYADGPTSCIAHYDVVESIKEEISQSRSLSTGDIRLATSMGLISADTIQSTGFNDGIFYPVDENPARNFARATRPSEVLSLNQQQQHMHVLALMVDFSDNVGSRSKSEFEDILFNQTNPDSMTSYYSEISNGKIQVSGFVTDYIRMPNPYSFYTANQSGMSRNFPNNTPGLLVDALNIFCLTNSLTQFDLDGDGFVDGIFLIHAGGGAEEERDPAVRPHKIWSHKWVLPSPFVSNGVKVYAYSTEPENGKVGVFAHEFGHVLGLPDLYDSTYRSRGVGDWCLMAGGSWGGAGDKPVRMSCWCLAKLGWITPNVVTKKSLLSLSPLANDPGACFRLWTKGRITPEYFLIENRQKAGRDSELPGEGLAIWHIDENQTSNTNPLGYLVGLVQADGKKDLENNRNAGDTADLFPGTKNVVTLNSNTNPSSRANDGSSTNVKISGITQANGIVALKVTV